MCHVTHSLKEFRLLAAEVPVESNIITTIFYCSGKRLSAFFLFSFSPVPFFFTYFIVNALFCLWLTGIAWGGCYATMARNVTLNERLNGGKYAYLWRGDTFYNPFDRGMYANAKEFVNMSMDYTNIFSLADLHSD